jgi:hypothetical protein
VPQIKIWVGLYTISFLKLRCAIFNQNVFWLKTVLKKDAVAIPHALICHFSTSFKAG